MEIGSGSVLENDSNLAGIARRQRWLRLMMKGWVRKAWWSFCTFHAMSQWALAHTAMQA